MTKWLEDPKNHNLDCGDNSCKYRTSTGGMRTNGGCRCARNKPEDVQRFLLRNYWLALDKIQKLEGDLAVEKLLEDKHG